MPPTALPTNASLPSITPTISTDATTKAKYLSLGPDYDSKFSTWSNDPKDMQLMSCFSQAPKSPSLASSFAIPNLIPVLVKQDSDAGNTYLLTDDKGLFYLWNEPDGRMWMFVKKPKLAEVVDQVLSESYGSTDLVQQFSRELRLPPQAA